ncbi:MAG: IclR family transcriptional regulator [Alphaproteobacteria bacterium]|nr:IclR family transcriptional regulator [Alphaproteobacteria bacterium]MBU1561099.1 IclR family transcriptional regulator [Alphaproteobacteria bacterium]MBU2303030.1 IclR family transcriptional regulator [Alphaproteobacteria bacterium]MBU2368368.1 IclR family transcriptional regulator [Alphaproteobacteria bacterium]
MDSKKSASPPPAILRAGSILKIIAARGGPVSATELAKMIGVPRSSTVNICVALGEIGLLRETERGFALGYSLGELGQAFFSTSTPVTNFTEFCQRTGPLPLTVQLGTLDEKDVVYLARQDGQEMISIASRTGGRLPANCTALGKAMMSALDPKHMVRMLEAWEEPFVSRTPKSIKTRTQLVEDVDRSRARGFAIDDEETTEGILCVAVPLPSLGGASELYAVSASMPKFSAKPQRIESTANFLKKMAQDLG